MFSAFIRVAFGALIAVTLAVPAADAAPKKRQTLFNFSSSQSERVQTARVRTNFSSGAPRVTYKGKRTVKYETKHKPGTIIVNTSKRRLFFVLEDGKAIEYGIGVGRAGFKWSGGADVARKAKWPAWYPPAAMRKREPHLPRMMPGGPRNPLGARALYLYKGGKDTLYRIHGTSQPHTIGLAVSSGCIRMLNKEVIDLYKRVRIGAKVVVI